MTNSNRLREEIVSYAKRLGLNSKIELFSFMVSLNIAHMENTNGIFFSLSNIDDGTINEIHKKIFELTNFETISNQSFENNKRNEDSADAADGDNAIEGNDYLEDDSYEKYEQRDDGVRSFDYDFDMVKDITKSVYKTKKSIHGKYSLAKKKYNKQYVVDIKKIDGNTDLNELVKEQYII